MKNTTTGTKPQPKTTRRTRKAAFDPKAHAAKGIAMALESAAKYEYSANKASKRACWVRSVMQGTPCFRTIHLEGNADWAFTVANSREMLHQITDQLNANDVHAQAELAIASLAVPFDTGIIDDINAKSAAFLANYDAAKAAKRHKSRSHKKAVVQ